MIAVGNKRYHCKPVYSWSFDEGLDDWFIEGLAARAHRPGPEDLLQCEHVGGPEEGGVHASRAEPAHTGFQAQIGLGGPHRWDPRDAPTQVVQVKCTLPEKFKAISALHLESSGSTLVSFIPTRLSSPR